MQWVSGWHGCGGFRLCYYETLGSISHGSGRRIPLYYSLFHHEEVQIRRPDGKLLDLRFGSFLVDIGFILLDPEQRHPLGRYELWQHPWQLAPWLGCSFHMDYSCQLGIFLSVQEM